MPRLMVSVSNPLEDSRKWALYYIATLLFKSHFRLNHISLSKNILRSLKVATGTEMSLSQFPRSHRVGFLYYCGVIHFLEEDYIAAEEQLTAAYDLCHFKAKKNLQLILTYLIPTKLLTIAQIAVGALLARYPSLVRLFQPLCDAIRAGNLQAYNQALERGEEEFVKRRIYLTLERGQDIILRKPVPQSLPCRRF
ncbi:hypothetical protein MRB53_040298 [Persea americana]|nr:hypothetical protein MRB53_040298 [Persea americana]